MCATPAQATIIVMFNDHLLRVLSRTRVDDSQRAHRQHIEARSGPAPRIAAVRRSGDEPLTIRHAEAADLSALEHLAALDSHRIPSGELFVGELDGRLVAAVSIDTGAVIADPFVPTAHMVELLRTAARPAPRPRARLAALPLRPLRAA
jgi:hypothetical protein